VSEERRGPHGDWLNAIEWGMCSENWWTQNGYEVHRIEEVRGVEAPEASGPDFTGVTVRGASLSNIEGEGAELGASGRGG
jgi:hypothetical protein